MAQHDYNIANATFPNTRTDINNALGAIATNNSGDTQPSTMFANQWWYETDTNKLYIRNEDNDAWIHILTLNQTNDTVSSVEGAATLAGIDDQSSSNDDQITITDSAVIINEDSDDVDFRVESSGNANMLFVDGGNNAVIINTDNSAGNLDGASLGVQGGVTFLQTGNSDNLTLLTTDADSISGPNLRLRRDSSSPADDDNLGSVFFSGDDSAGNETNYAAIKTVASDVTDGTEDGYFNISVANGGSLDLFFGMTGAETVINDTSKDHNFRVESNGNANMLFVDGGNDRVGIGTSSPSTGTTLHLNNTSTVLKIQGASGNNSYIDFTAANTWTIGTNTGAGVNDHSFGIVDGSNIAIECSTSEVIINQNSQNIDFRVEGDSLTHLFFVNAVNSNNPNGTIGMNSVNSDGNFLEINNGKGGVYCANIINSENDASATLNGIRVFFSEQNKDDNASNYFVGQNTGAVRVIIHSDGDIVNHDGAYNAISDERIKEQIADASSQWDDIKALKMRKFKFKSDIAEKGDSNALWRLGVVAQELEASGMNGLVKPEVNYKEGDQETKDYPYTEDDREQGLIPDGKDVGDIKQAKTADVGDIKQYKEVKYSILHTKALKALQEAMAKIEDLEARVTTLEG